MYLKDHLIDRRRLHRNFWKETILSLLMYFSNVKLALGLQDNGACFIAPFYSIICYSYSFIFYSYYL